MPTVPATVAHCVGRAIVACGLSLSLLLGLLLISTPGDPNAASALEVPSGSATAPGAVASMAGSPGQVAPMARLLAGTGLGLPEVGLPGEASDPSAQIRSIGHGFGDGPAAPARTSSIGFGAGPTILAETQLLRPPQPCGQCRTGHEPRLVWTYDLPTARPG